MLQSRSCSVCLLNQFGSCSSGVLRSIIKRTDSRGPDIRLPLGLATAEMCPRLLPEIGFGFELSEESACSSIDFYYLFVRSLCVLGMVHCIGFSDLVCIAFFVYITVLSSLQGGCKLRNVS